MNVTNDNELIIQGVSHRLMECYAAELICLVLGHYEGSHWYGGRRWAMHQDLNLLLKGA